MDSTCRLAWTVWHRHCGICAVFSNGQAPLSARLLGLFLAQRRSSREPVGTLGSFCRGGSDLKVLRYRTEKSPRSCGLGEERRGEMPEGLQVGW